MHSRGGPTYEFQRPRTLRLLALTSRLVQGAYWLACQKPGPRPDRITPPKSLNEEMSMAKQPRDELGKRIDADPRVSPWGIRTADPYPQGIGIFFWYDTEAELREAIWDGSHSVDMDLSLIHI